MEANQIICGDCLEVMKGFPDNSIDTIITDPPYGLKFMGKKWDYNVPSVEIWQECLRVLKPGGTMLCFAGSRTQHRMAVNVEDAGFILKDCIMWLYGSGFPKATDISKHIDKMAGKEREKEIEFAKYIKSIREKANKTVKDFNKEFGYIAGCAWWETERQNGYRPPNHKDYKILKNKYNASEKYQSIVDRWYPIGKKISEKIRGNAGFSNEQVPRPWKKKIGEKIDITAPATPEATLWNGWKSHGLKPAYEPILVAMKPNEGSYANNALKWGVAGLNIDGGRISYQGKNDIKKASRKDSNILQDKKGQWTNKKMRVFKPQGRYPANIILDEESARMLDEQAPKTGAFAKVKSGHSGKSKGIYHDYAQRGDDGDTFYADGLQGASRFFYCAKASKSERNGGCEGLEEKERANINKIMDKAGDFKTGSGNDRTEKFKNNHPTVKPLALMEYLCTLTKTPTGGIVLDPFCGSGTTLMACKGLKRDYIGIDDILEYCEIARRRIKVIPEPLF